MSEKSATHSPKPPAPSLRTEFAHIRRMRDTRFPHEIAAILPGEFFVSAEPMIVYTVLGSCVSACIRDAVVGVGGMNHFMLPVKQGDPHADVFFAARYGAAAMEYLINNLLHLGAQRDRLVAKVFGGGKVMRNMMTDIGGQNIEFVRLFLRQENIPLWSEDLGGDLPRKVYFFPHTGQVIVKRLSHVHNDTLVNRELSYFDQVSRKPTSGDVELFQ